MNVDGRTNTLIITDIPEGLEQVTELITLLDVPEKQVEIEARIVEASTNFARALGVQLGFGIGRLGGRFCLPMRIPPLEPVMPTG